MPDPSTGIRIPIRIRVWDTPVRLLHWTLAGAVLTAWLSAHSASAWHERAGYVALAAVLLRLLWCLWGSRPARLGSFVRGSRATWAYARALWAGRERRYLSHNPLGGWMALALWAGVAATAGTGWLYTTDAFWGEAWLDQLHACLAWGVLSAVPLHLLGVLFTSLRHRENLVLAMIWGRKRLGRDRP
jgi:cytochrome b